MLKSKENGNVTTVTANVGQGPNENPIKISYTDVNILGSGSFGVVYRAKLLPTGETIAIKTIVQDKRYRNRELGIMRKLSHPNMLKLKYFYYSKGVEKVNLCLVLEFFPTDLFTLLKQHSRAKRSVPLPYVKIYAYQLFRSLAYLHSVGICHRDIKPANLLINTETGVLKLCDFGSAKHLVKGETNVSYICSRYYRAPELLFGCAEYTIMIDVWSAGCVLVELILGAPVFTSDNHVNQLVEIMKVLGTPSKEEIKQMNKTYPEYNFPYIDPTPWQEVFKSKAIPDAIDLISRLLVYTPSARITPLQACAHKFFNKLREPGAKLLNNKELPPLFNFSEHELKIQPNLNSILIPSYLKDNFRTSNDNSATGSDEVSSTVMDDKSVVSDNDSDVTITL